jgi:hypothetical protein
MPFRGGLGDEDDGENSRLAEGAGPGLPISPARGGVMNCGDDLAPQRVRRMPNQGLQQTGGAWRFFGERLSVGST